MIKFLIKFVFKLPSVILFFIFYAKEIIVANLHIAYDVLTPSHHMTPGIIALPLEVRTDLEIISFANLITMTPGTLSVDISPDRRTLYVHAMYITNLVYLKHNLKNKLEIKIIGLLR